MRKPRLDTAKIKEILAEQAAGKSVADITKAQKISPATFYNWKAKYGDGTTGKRGRPPKARVVAMVTRTAATAAPSSLAEENRHLRKIVVDLMLEVDRLRKK